MFGGEEGRLAALPGLVGFRSRGHQLDWSDLHIRQLLQTQLSVSDHRLHHAQLLCHHGDLGLGGKKRKRELRSDVIRVFAAVAEG